MFHRRVLIPLFVLFALAVLAGAIGCGQKGGEQVLAHVGDRVINAEYFQTRLVKMDENSLPRDDDGNLLDMSSIEGKRAFLDVIIDKELMVSKALQLGYDKDTQIQVGLSALKEYHAMIYFWKDEIGDPTKYVSNEDLDFYYSRLGERRDCHFIIADMEDTALQAVADAREGLPWSEIVAKYHSNPTNATSEPIINVSWGQYRDDFEEPIFAAEEGGVTDPIPTEHGWWVLQVDKITMGDKPDLEAIRGKVLMSISKRNANLRRDELLKRLAEDRHFDLDEYALRVVYDGLPVNEQIIDPVTNQPTPQESLLSLDVATEDYDKVILSYVLDVGPYALSVADFKVSFDKQNVFERPKKGELLGGLRTKLKNNAQKSIALDEARRRGYFEDERVERDAYRQIEEMLVERLHSEVVDYEEYVSPEELDAFWEEYGYQYAKPERRTGKMVRCADIETARKALEGIVSGDLTWKMATTRFGNDPALDETFGRFQLIRADDTGIVHDQLFGMEMDEFAEVFELDGTWAVLQLTKIVPPENPTKADMAEAVGQRIRNRRMDVALRALLDGWTTEFGVEVDEDLLATMPSWQEALTAAANAQLAMPEKR